MNVITTRVTSLDEIADDLASAHRSIAEVSDRSAAVSISTRSIELSGAVSLSLDSGDAPGIARTGDSGRGDRPDVVSLTLRRGGRPTTMLETGPDGRSVVIEPGRAILSELKRPAVFVNPSWSDQLQIDIDRRTLQTAAGGQVPGFVSLPADSLLMRTLSAAAREALTPGPTWSASDVEALARMTVDLVAAQARTLLDQQVANPLGRQALLRTLLTDVDENLHDPNLSPADLAARHFISLRYVHVLFGDIECPPAAYIRQRRLERAYSLLRDPLRQHVSITAISYQVGFSDPGTFVRAFRRKFGETPTELRPAAGARILDRNRRYTLPRPGPTADGDDGRGIAIPSAPGAVVAF